MGPRKLRTRRSRRPAPPRHGGLPPSHAGRPPPPSDRSSTGAASPHRPTSPPVRHPGRSVTRSADHHRPVGEELQRHPGRTQSQLQRRSRPDHRLSRPERGRQDHHAADPGRIGVGDDGNGDLRRHPVRATGEAPADASAPCSTPTSIRAARVATTSGCSPPRPAPRMRRVDELLDLVGLGKDGRRPAGQYSLGMRQRLALASAAARRSRLPDPGRAGQRSRPRRHPLAAALPARLRRQRPGGAGLLPPAERGPGHGRRDRGDQQGPAAGPDADVGSPARPGHHAGPGVRSRGRLSPRWLRSMRGSNAARTLRVPISGCTATRSPPSGRPCSAPGWW